MEQRAIFISDFHLGSRLAKAEQLLSFIESHEAATWYLVGDIYDLKRLRRRHHWPASHAKVIRALRDKARKGARVVYLPGNHDPELRRRAGHRSWLPGIEVQPWAIHTTADGHRLLVIHGDQHEPDFRDDPVRFAAGCACYIFGVGASELVNEVRGRFGLGYWSLGGYLKDRTLPHVEPIAQYRANLRAAARAHGADGVVCGHIHHAAAELEDGVLYLNCGDWVDSCTALVEDWHGDLRLMRWTGVGRRAKRPVPKTVPKPVPAQ
jgi:UDP-2,3-diacylglucosamine pyrophosphatase LpxH